VLPNAANRLGWQWTRKDCGEVARGRGGGGQGQQRRLHAVDGLGQQRPHRDCGEAARGEVAVDEAGNDGSTPSMASATDGTRILWRSYSRTEQTAIMAPQRSQGRSTMATRRLQRSSLRPARTQRLNRSGARRLIVQGRIEKGSPNEGHVANMAMFRERGVCTERTSWSVKAHNYSNPRSSNKTEGSRAIMAYLRDAVV
jgi:hypothetical protein